MRMIKCVGLAAMKRGQGGEIGKGGKDGWVVILFLFGVGVAER